MKTTTIRHLILVPVLFSMSISLSACISYSGSPEGDVLAAREYTRSVREQKIKDRERARVEREKAARKAKENRVFREARERQRLAAEEFQVRAGGESGGGGGGGDGH